MKALTVSATGATEGIGVSRTPFPHIPVGKRGSGGRYTMLPLAKSFGQQLAADEITAGFPIRTRERQWLNIVEERFADRRALVKLSVQAGFGGVGYVTSTEYREEPCPWREAYVPPQELYGIGPDGPLPGHLRACGECGAECEQQENGTWMHPFAGNVNRYLPLPDEPWEYYHEPSNDVPPRVFVLAEGMVNTSKNRRGGRSNRNRHNRYGCRYPEYVMVMEDGAAVRVLRTGTLPEDQSAELWVTWAAQELTVAPAPVYHQ